MYDIAIVGAGINGSCLAYEFSKIGKKVVIFDETSIAGGGSGAAGAFISPKFSKQGDLKDLLHNAFLYSMHYYEKNFSNYFTKAPLLHIAKDDESSKILKFYKSKSDIYLKTPSDELLHSISTFAKTQENIYIDAGVVDAIGVCNTMCNMSKYINEKVEDLIYDNGMWIINEIYSAKNVVLTTGAYQNLLGEPYINIRGVWGHRIDITTTTQNLNSIHQFVSISPKKNGVLAIGATHNVHYNPQTSKEPYDINKGRAELLEKASKTIKLDNIKVIKDYTGLRSGSIDYMPLVGALVISKETLETDNSRYNIERSNTQEYTYYPNLYMMNGSSGYGFVLAPYLSKMLKEHIINDKEIDNKFLPARYFTRWAKKMCN